MDYEGCVIPTWTLRDQVTICIPAPMAGRLTTRSTSAAHIISRLKDQSGKILIPGFYDKVRPLTQEERRLLAEFPLTEVRCLGETGANQLWGEPDFTMVERLGARPTLDVNGIVGGYTGAGTKTVLPSRVHAKISMRLVPDQEVSEIFEHCSVVL